MKAFHTLKTLAERLGMPRTTVAAALNPKLAHKIGPVVRARVRKAARDCDYVPNRLARCLSLGRTQEIVFATSSSLRYAYVHDLIEELVGALAAHQYRLDLEMFRKVSEGPALYRTFARGRCDGVVLDTVHPEHRSDVESIQKRGIPVVVLSAVDGLATNTVEYDRTDAAYLGTAHLLAQGHRRVALITHEGDDASEQQRVQGYRTALKLAGLSFDESLILPHRAGADLLPLWRQIRSLAPPPTGIVCYNAEKSAQLEAVILREGVRIPEEISLVSLGDALVNTWVEVPITAVDTNPHGIATAVVELLLARIAHPGAPFQHIMIKPTLIVRKSSGTPAR